MSHQNNNRYSLVNGLVSRFSKDLKESLQAFSDEEKINVIDILVEVANRFERKEDYDEVYRSCIDTILTTYRSKSKKLFSLKLTDYFVQDSLMFTDLLFDKDLGDTYEQNMNDDEYKSFIKQVRNILFNERYYLYMNSSSDEEKKDITVSDSELSNEIQTRNKEHTAHRRALFLHFLDKHYKITQDKKPFAEVAQFLTGNSFHNLYNSLRNPVGISSDQKFSVSSKSLKQDLLFVKKQFEKLHQEAIIKYIDQEINALD